MYTGCMILALIFLGLSQIISVLLAYRLFTRYISKKQAEIQEQVLDSLHRFVDSPGEGKPSQFAIILDSAGVVVGGAAARNIMKSLGGADGHAGNVASGIAGELQAQVNPLVGLLSGGRRGKGAAMMRLAELLGPMFNRNAPGANGGGDPPLQPRLHR